ncbi:hypothetical protein GC197_17415 [bacterium]|nr:hypothetical protein [bacterium]
MNYDQLSFVDAKRQGGRNKTERLYYDFAVNGQPLVEIVQPGDFITPFGWLSLDLQRQYFCQLLLRQPSELSSGRVPLYICPECADLGCGSVTVKIVKYDDCLVWSEFGFENNYEDGPINIDPSVRDFAFHKTEYYQALNRFGFE